MLVWILKPALLQLFALAVCTSLRRHSALTRRRVLICGVLAVCTLPLVELLGPGVSPRELAPALAAISLDLVPAATVGQVRKSATLQTEVDGLAAGPTNSVAVILVATWLLGVALLVLRWAVGLLRVSRLRKSSAPVVERSWLSIAARFTDRPVRLSLSDRIASPMTVGVVEPSIILPARAQRWPEARLTMAIAHEVAHIRRLDTLWINVSLLLRALQWPSPLAWWFHRQLRQETEQSADEEVVRGGTGVHGYSEFLLELAARTPPVGELAMARPGGMAKRLCSLSSIAAQRASLASRWVGVAVVGFGCGLGCLHPNDAQDRAAVSSTLDLGDWQSAVSATALQLRADNPGAEVRIGVMRVETGELVATAGAVDAPYASGSAIKPLTVAAALEEGVPPTTVLDCSAGKIELGGREFRDHITHGELTVTEALARSSNVAMVQLLKHIQPEQLFVWLQRLGVDTAGRLDRDDPAGTAIGSSLDLSITELLNAYTTIANGGVSAATGDRVIRTETARAVLDMLTQAVTGPGATGRRARVDGTTVAGKTGTMDRPHGDDSTRTVTFVGLVPADRPRWAIAVAVDGARPDAVGGTVAAPAFASIVRLAGQL